MPTTDEVGEQWLIIRRPRNDSDDVTFYTSNAPVETSLEILAAIASSHWCVEQLLEEAKGEAGLADYERGSHQSWVWHIHPSMVCHPQLAPPPGEGGAKKL